MTPQNYNWFIHTMLSYHTRKVITRQAKKAAKGMQEEEGDDTGWWLPLLWLINDNGPRGNV